MALFTPPTTSICRRGSVGGDPERSVLWVRGEHDLATKVSIAVGIARAAYCDGDDVLVDLSGVTFMDASTVSAIVGGRNRLRSRGQALDVRAPSSPARRVLTLCGLAHLIQQEPVPATGAAAALASWVEVRPIASAGEIDPQDARSTERSTTRQPARVLAATDAHVEGALAPVQVNRRGP